MNEKLTEISDILCPKKFIERHFGNEDEADSSKPPEFLYEKEIKEVP